MDGTANQGSRAGYAREDHRHPTDTTRAADNEVVHLAGNEEITGLKTFTNGMKLPAGDDDTITITGSVSVETLEPCLAVNGKLLPTIDYTNDHYAKKSDITGVYKAKGNLVSANLNASLLNANSLGWVYNITDEFTINENFLEYDASNPKTYPAGTNVVIVQATPNTYKFDVLSGFIDTSTFATDSTVVHKTGNETITGVKNFASRPVFSNSGGIRWDAGSTGLGYVAKLHSLNNNSPILDFISDDDNKAAVSFSLRNTVTDGGNDTYIYGIKSGLSGNEWLATENYVDGKLSEKTDKSTSVNITLTSTNWSSGIYTYTNSAITATNIIELYPASTITSTQFEALQSANIIGGTQSAGSIQLKAMGDVPTIDIPIVLTIRQDT